MRAAGTVAVSIPPVVFTADDGWPADLQRGRPTSGLPRFAAGPGVGVTDVGVSATGGRIDCPEADRATEDYVTTLQCRLQPGVPARSVTGTQVGTTTVRLAVTTTTGTFTQEDTHTVRNGRS